MGPDPDCSPRSAAELVADADRLCRQVRATRIRDAARRLPDTIAALTNAVWTTPSTQLWQALASAYRTAHDISVKLGYYDLSAVSLDRMDWAAQRASDPCLAAVRQYMRALVYFREGEYRIGRRLIDSGHDLLGYADDTREALAVTGQLHLGASVLAARAADQDGVETHIEAASRLADRIGDASEVHWLSFGPANVSMHQLSAQVEMRHYDEALSLARQVQLPASVPASRRAHFLVDRARTEMETNHAEAASRSLSRARQIAPEQTRYHPGARETIKGLVQMSRRTPDTLNHMAVWIGL